jgi:hypothetical protein
MKEEHQAVALVQQTQPDNCASACLAMVTGNNIDLVTSQFHALYRGQKIEMHDYLISMDVPFTRCMAGDRTMPVDAVVIVSVPSLNIVGGLHYVVIETLPDGSGWLLDPNRGREGGKYYVMHESLVDNDLAVPLNGWEPHYFIPRSHYL